MIRASALYIVIVVTLVIGILCSSLITIAYYQRLHVQKNHLIKKLHVNASSGINLLLADFENVTSGEEVVVDLFDDERDSVAIKKLHWGIFDVATVRAFSGTLNNIKSVLYGFNQDAESKISLYLADQNHQLALAGKTSINGLCYLPESGVKRAYIEGENFTGSNLINGEIRKSKTILPSLNSSMIQTLMKNISGSFDEATSTIEISEKDTVVQSFNKNTLFVSANSIRNLSNKNFEGNIVLFSNDVIEIDSSCKFSDILIFAPAVVIKNNFYGSLQIFCTDSIIIKDNSVLSYPSALGIIKKDFKVQQPFVKVMDKSTVAGMVFTYTDVQDLQKTLIVLDKEAFVEGQVYSDGFIDLKGTVYGSVYCYKFILKTPSSVYENHLLNATIDYSKLSEFYVGSSLISSGNHKEIVKWLE